MNRIALIPTAELMALAHHVVLRHVDDMHSLADYRPLVEYVMDDYCYGPGVTRAATIAEILGEVGVPDTDCALVQERLDEALVAAVQSAFKIIYPSRQYSHRWLGEDLVVEERVCTPWNIAPVRAVPPDESMDNWDFEPERLRQRA